MKRFTFTGESAANLEKIHALGTPGTTEYVDIISLNISTRGGDVAADTSIQIKDGGIVKWKAYLRSAKEFGKNFPNIGMIKIPGAFTILTDDAGANVIVTVSCVYDCYTAIEAAAKG